MAIIYIFGAIIAGFALLVFLNYRDKYTLYYCESQGRSPRLDQYTYLDFKTLKNLMEVNRSAGKDNWHYDEKYYTVYYSAFSDKFCGRKYVIVPRSDWREYKKYIKSLIEEDERIEEEEKKELQRKVALHLMKVGQEDIDTLKGIINENLKKIEETTKQINENLKFYTITPLGLNVWEDIQTGRFYTFDTKRQQIEVGWGWMQS